MPLQYGELKYVDAVEFVADLPLDPHTVSSLISLPVLPPSTFTPRRSSRSMKGKHTETLFQNEVFQASLSNPAGSHQNQVLSYHDALQTDHETG